MSEANLGCGGVHVVEDLAARGPGDAAPYVGDLDRDVVLGLVNF